jgi:FMN phosphatase YigB (HAD superfamily)
LVTPAGEARAVVFDLDETLVPVQTFSRWQWAWRPNGPALSDRHVKAALRRELHAWDRRRWRGLVGAEPPVGPGDYSEHLRRTLLAVADRPLPEPEVSAVVDRFLRPVGPFEPFPDVPAALAALRARSIPFGVLSPMPDDAARGFLKRSGIAVDRLVPSSGGEPPPPDRAAFRRATDFLGVRPSQAFYIGDLYWSDVRAAARAGLRSILIDRDGRVPAASGVRLHRLTELETWIDRPPEPPETTPAGEGPGPEPTG